MNRPENTAIRRRTASRPLKDAIARGWLDLDDRVLDFGCGRGADVIWLRDQGYKAEGFDPCTDFGWSASPQGQFDVVCLIYVVNVLDRIEGRRRVVRDAWAFLRPGGVMIVVARSEREINDQARAKGWPKHRDGYWSNASRGMFQKGHSNDDLGGLVNSLPCSSIVEAPTNQYSGIRATKACA